MSWIPTRSLQKAADQDNVEVQYRLATHCLDNEVYYKVIPLLLKLVKGKSNDLMWCSSRLLRLRLVDKLEGLKWYAESLSNLNADAERTFFDLDVMQTILELACKHNHRPLIMNHLEYNKPSVFTND